MVEIKHPYPETPHAAVRKTFSKPSRTKSDMADECDINNIMARVAQDGVTGHLNTKEGIYADCTNPIEFQEAQALLIQAQQSFMELPSKVRKQFDNEPGQFLEFAENPDNHDEMISMGLMPPKVDQTPTPPEKDPTLQETPIEEPETTI